MVIRSGDADLDVVDEGSGTPIVLIHAFPLNKETWDAQAAALALHARVIRFDLRGLGGSSVPDGPYLMPTLAGDVAAVLDALGVERAVIAGHSLGSYVTFAFYRMFAERALALAIVCGNALADDRAGKLERYGLADRVEREGAGALAASYVDRYFAPPVYARHPELVAKAAEIIRGADPAGAAGLLRGVAERDPSADVLADIDVPVAVLAGTMDAFNPMENSRDLAQNIRGAELTAVECGHFPQWEDPAATTGVLMRLLARVERP